MIRSRRRSRSARCCSSAVSTSRHRLMGMARNNCRLNAALNATSPQSMAYRAPRRRCARQDLPDRIVTTLVPQHATYHTAGRIDPDRGSSADTHQRRRSRSGPCAGGFAASVSFQGFRAVGPVSRLAPPVPYPLLRSRQATRLSTGINASLLATLLRSGAGVPTLRVARVRYLSRPIPVRHCSHSCPVSPNPIRSLPMSDYHC